jgi:PAS domain S-box-containing protein
MSESKFHRRPTLASILSYGVAILSVAAALSIALFLKHHLEVSPFLCAVMFAAWFGGVLPGMAAIILSTLFLKYFFIAPVYSMAIDINEVPRIILFVLAALFVILLSAAQRRAERKLRKAERELRITIDAIPILAWSAGPDGFSEFHNQRWLDYTGLYPAEAQGLGWGAAIHPGDLAKLVEKWRLHLASGEAGEFEGRLRRFDGEYRWFLFRVEPLHDEGGNIIKWYGTNTDIEDRIRAQDTLRENEQRFRDFTEVASDWHWETDTAHRYLSISEAAHLVHGVSGQKVIGFRRWEFADDVEDEPLKWNDHRTTLAARLPFRRFTYRTKTRDGSSLYIASSGKPRFDADGQFLGYRGISTDVTAAVRATLAEDAVRRAQAELAHVTRVATLGEMTASIAHEINQPLAAIVTNGQAGLRWLNRETPEAGEAQLALQRILRDADRASNIIRRIREFSKKSSPEMTRLDINDVIAEVLLLIRREAVVHRVSPRLDLASGLPAVYGDRVQLQQVIINLVMNGIEAMEPVEDRERQLLVRSGRQQGECEQVIVEVQDWGVGIDPESANLLFNAFYTTKAKGMGMGLSICRTIIESHGGRLWASGNTGPGTTFQFALPALSGD